MDIFWGFFVLFLLLIISAIKGISPAYALIIGLGIFIYIGKKHGYPIKELLRMCLTGGKKSLIVLRIFILIGGIIATWMAAGTIPTIVFYGIKLIHPKLFIFSAFLVTCVVSLLIGTSLGTASTIGIAIMIMARSGEVYLPLVAGAVLSGAYLGDRNSPMSSSANLVAEISNTDLYKNISNMIRTSIIPFFITLIIYGVLSFLYPISTTSSILSEGIGNIFNTNLLVLLPAFSIILLSILRVDVKASMLISILISLIISISIQKFSLLDNLKFLIFGFKMKDIHPIAEVLQGGGILSMMKSGLIVFISSAFTGIFEETDLLKFVVDKINVKKPRHKIFGQTILISLATSIIGCTQVLAVMLTHILSKKNYRINNLSREELSIDLENSAIVIAPIIPWNIAALIPLTTMGIGPIGILFSFYLFLLPIIYWIELAIKYRLGRLSV